MHRFAEKLVLTGALAALGAGSAAGAKPAFVACTARGPGATRVLVSEEGALEVTTLGEGTREFAPVSQKPVSEEAILLTGYSRALREHALLTVNRRGRSLLQVYGTYYELTCGK